MKSIIPICTLVALTGCASITGGTTQVISVQTTKGGESLSGAACTLVNEKGTWFVTTPGTVSIHRAYADLNVKCEKEGSDPGILTVKSSTKGMAWGNILVGGIIGAAVDMGDGAAYDYPPLLTVSMGMTETIAPPPSKKAAVPVATAPTSASETAAVSAAAPK